jgi:hypothetical protein
VELFVSILQRRLPNRGEFDSVEHLAERIIDVIRGDDDEGPLPLDL